VADEARPIKRRRRKRRRLRSVSVLRLLLLLVVYGASLAASTVYFVVVTINADLPQDLTRQRERGKAMNSERKMKELAAENMALRVALKISEMDLRECERKYKRLRRLGLERVAKRWLRGRK